MVLGAPGINKTPAPKPWATNDPPTPRRSPPSFVVSSLGDGLPGVSSPGWTYAARGAAEGFVFSCFFEARFFRFFCYDENQKMSIPQNPEF